LLLLYFYSIKDILNKMQKKKKKNKKKKKKKKKKAFFLINYFNNINYIINLYSN